LFEVDIQFWKREGSSSFPSTAPMATGLKGTIEMAKQLWIRVNWWSCYGGSPPVFMRSTPSVRK